MSYLIRIRKYAAPVLILIIASPVTHASPNIRNITGDFVQGAIVTISGSGFSDIGYKTTFYDQVDNQTIYKTLADGADVPLDQGPWTLKPTQWDTPIEVVRSGDLRTEDSTAAYYGEQRSSLGYPTALNDSQTSNIYVSWWFKPSQTVDQGGSNKFIRIWDRSDGLGTRISWTQMHMTYDAREINYVPPTSWETTQPIPDEWNRFEIYVSGETGTITARLNGVIKHNLNDFKKSPNSEGLTVRLIGFDPSDSGPYENYSFRMKDIYVSETRARVEISDSPTWDFKSHREVLEPLSWSDSSIDIQLDKFSFQDLNELYLYVIDKSGNVNTKGFPLCGDCPAAPVMIRVN